MQAVGDGSPRQSEENSDAAASSLHRELSIFNRRRLTPRGPEDGWREELAQSLWLHTREGDYVEAERARVLRRAASAPRDPRGFVAWFEALRAVGPGQNDGLFPFLAQHATHEQMRWFIHQEVAGEAGFEDLVALTQLKMPDVPKMELARNFWDEMGRGNPSGMHGPLLQRLGEQLRLEELDSEIVWEALALSNLLVALAANRRYAFHSIGALGAVELTAPDRAAQVHTGLKRLGVAASGRLYYALHQTLDIKHSESWNRDVLWPLVRERPECAPWIAEGALMRLEAGARCFERYRRELSLGPLPAEAAPRLH